MRCVRFLCLVSASLLAAAHAPTASAHDKPKDPIKPKDSVICGTPVPTNPGPFPPLPMPVPTGPVVVRDHRTPIIVRDHRNPTGPIIRDHRDNTGPIIRDHRTPVTVKGKPVYSPVYTVPTRGSVDASQASGGVIVTDSPRRPVVRDHRKPTRKPGGMSIDLPGPLPNIPLPKIPNPF